MLVHKLCQQFCPEKLNINLDQKLGDGSDGEVFSLQDDPSKVIKLGVLFGDISEIEQQYNKLSSVLQFIIDKNPQPYVRVYAQANLGIYSRTLVGSNMSQYFLLYYYIMENLSRISEDEKKVFHSILSHEDNNIMKNYSIDKIKEILIGLQKGLDFNFKNIILFCSKIAEAPIEHHDMHIRNIMKTNLDQFKLIDLDSCKIKGNNV